MNSFDIYWGYVGVMWRIYSLGCGVLEFKVQGLGYVGDIWGSRAYVGVGGHLRVALYCGYSGGASR